MASPFEIIALAETIAGVGSKIYKFFSNLKDAPQEIRDLCDELELLRTVLVRIGITSSSALKTSSSSHQPLGLDTIFACLKHCEAEFNTLWLAISPLRSDRGLDWSKVVEKTRKSVTWVVKSDEIEKASRRLEGLKQTLLLGISLSEMEADAGIAEGLSSVEAQIEANGALVVRKAEESQAMILAHVHQLEHRLLQKIEELSRVAETQHEEGDLRISQITETFPSITTKMEEKDTPGSGVHDGMKTASTVRSPVTRQPLWPDRRETIEQALPHRAGVTPRVENPDQPPPAVDLDSFLGPDFKQSLQAESEQHDLSRLMGTILEASQKNIEYGLPKKLKRFMSSLSDNSAVFESFYGTASQYQSLVWGSIKLIVKAASHVETHFSAVYDALAEMQDAFQMCEREYRLYPEHRVRELFEELCKEMLFAAASSIKVVETSTSRRTIKGLLNGDQQLRMKDTTIRIKSLSEKVIREVEYLHRRELREAHQRLREVDRKQDEALRMLEEQRRILVSLQEEQKLLALVADHQKVLQLLQQLLARHK